MICPSLSGKAKSKAHRLSISGSADSDFVFLDLEHPARPVRITVMIATASRRRVVIYQVTLSPNCTDLAGYACVICPKAGEPKEVFG